MTKAECELIAETLAYCDLRCDTEEERHVVQWVTEQLAETIARIRAKSLQIGH